MMRSTSRDDQIRVMVHILRGRLTEQQFCELTDLMDEPPAGPLWEAMCEEAEKIDPNRSTSREEKK